MSENQFDDWPENLPRETLIHLLRGAMREAAEVEKILGFALGFAAGDGEVVPADQPVIGEHTPVTLAEAAAQKIKALAKRARYAREPRVFLACEEIPAGVAVADQHIREGEFWPPSNLPSFFDRDVVEVFVPDYDAAVAEARTYRAAMDELVAVSEELGLYDEENP